jgi:hypothetical protein
MCWDFLERVSRRLENISLILYIVFMTIPNSRRPSRGYVEYPGVIVPYSKTFIPSDSTRSEIAQCPSCVSVHCRLIWRQMGSLCRRR